MRQRKKKRKSPAERDPLPAQRGKGRPRPGPNLDDPFEATQFLDRFLLAVLTLIEARGRVFGALKGQPDRPGPSRGEQLLAHEISKLATSEELQERLSDEELRQAAEDLTLSLDKTVRWVASSEAARKWWLNRKTLDTQNAMRPLVGKVSLEGCDVVDVTEDNPMGTLVLKPEYVGRRESMPRIWPKMINDLAAGDAGLSGERVVRKLAKDRINLENVAPGVLQPLKK